MKKVVLAALCTTLAATAASGAPTSDWKAVSTALHSIYSRAGMTVLERIGKCKISPQKQASWVEVLAADKPEYAAKKGDTVVMLKMDFPTVPKVGNYPSHPGMKNVTALWVIGKNHRITPVSSWADQLITKPYPLAENYGMKC